MPIRIQSPEVLDIFRELVLRRTELFVPLPDLVVRGLRSVGPEVQTKGEIIVPLRCEVANVGRYRVPYQVTLTAYAAWDSATRRVPFSETARSGTGFAALGLTDWLVVSPLESSRTVEVFGFAHLPASLVGREVTVFVKVDDEKLGEDEFADPAFGRQREVNEANNISERLTLSLHPTRP